MADALAGGNSDVVSKTLNVFYISGISNVNLDFDRMIAFDRNGRSLIDWQRVTDDPTAPPFRNEGTDLSPIPDVKRITSNTLVDGDDKFSGSDPVWRGSAALFLYDCPGQAGQPGGRRPDDRNQGRPPAARARSAVSQAPITTFYNLQGEAIGTTFVPRAELASLNMRPDVIAALSTNSCPVGDQCRE